MDPSNEKQIEIEMEMVPHKYLDVITCEFAYDPVRLPVDQDPTQSLYDRKTLEMIWETKREAQNPYTRQWFNAKTAIPQTELRQEMEDYIKLRNFSASNGAELDVIEEYTKVLDEGDMKQYLDILEKSLSEKVTTKKQCSTMWKKINLLRVYCQFHCKNIETFRSLDGFRYLNELIIQIRTLLNNDSIEMDTKEAAGDLCKEISRTIDVTGLKPVDIHNVTEEKKIRLIAAYIRMICHVYLHNESYMKIESLMLRLFCKIFDEMNAQVEQIIGEFSYRFFLDFVGSVLLERKFSQMNAKDINSEDLNHEISILRRTWITFSYFGGAVLSQMLVNAVILCIAREIDRIEDTRGLSEGQLLEAQAEGRHNSEALQQGLCLLKDILIKEGPSATKILEGSVDIVEEIVRMFKHFTRQDENGHQTSGSAFCAKKGCKVFECFHSRIAQLGLGLSAAIQSIGGPSLDTQVFLEFVKSGSTIAS